MASNISYTCDICGSDIEDEEYIRYVLVGDEDALRHAGSGDEWLVCMACEKAVVNYLITRHDNI